MPVLLFSIWVANRFHQNDVIIWYSTYVTVVQEYCFTLPSTWRISMRLRLMTSFWWNLIGSVISPSVSRRNPDMVQIPGTVLYSTYQKKGGARKGGTVMYRMLDEMMLVMRWSAPWNGRFTTNTTGRGTCMFICIPCTCTCAMHREQRIGAICMVPGYSMTYHTWYIWRAPGDRVHTYRVP